MRGTSRLICTRWINRPDRPAGQAALASLLAAQLERIDRLYETQVPAQLSDLEAGPKRALLAAESFHFIDRQAGLGANDQAFRLVVPVQAHRRMQGTYLGRAGDGNAVLAL